jgi:hypothetical protein
VVIVRQGCRNSSRILGPLRNSRRQKCDTKQVPPLEPTSIRRYSTKCIHHIDLAPLIFAPLLWVSCCESKSELPWSIKSVKFSDDLNEYRFRN